ncbi:monovalent cation:H+ antiporter, CPA1 (nhx1) [Dispira parvispora]|uniref:Sodium/hydrogen exchanger n=1 Tax=Dispira parvispora TaxID=1520584 RepID=A0A9W8E2H3_9FUNG|nr:monovalent cation:H+ antiporter, CPA1 (nhx1) [Dispira parvispora]
MASDEEEKELYSSWALFLLVSLTICSLLLSYFLQRRRIQVIHESVVSMVAGMAVGLIIRVANLYHIRDMVTFDHTYFFNLLLPPIILNCGYSLNKQHFFRSAVPVFTFAFGGTFISAMVIGLLAYVYSATGLEGVSLSFLESLMAGAILSSTDPVAVLAIFNQLKVDTKLYTIIFGESMLNDAVSIVLYEAYKRFRGHTLHISNLFQLVGLFLLVFTVSLVIGMLCGAVCALILKLTQVYRYRHLEICIITMVAYNTYFVSNALQMSGIVSLLFCGISIKHYAYDNMSPGTQHTLHDMFHVLAQLSENFIFIYLGIALFTNLEAIYKPVFIIYMILVILISRFVAVFPLSRLLNYVTTQVLGRPEKCISYEHQSMLFWAGLRGAVAFALAGDMPGHGGHVTRAMVLVVVVFSVVVFGGSTPTMIRLLNIPTGVSDVPHPSSVALLPEEGQWGRMSMDDDASEGWGTYHRAQSPVDGAPPVSATTIDSAPEMRTRLGRISGDEATTLSDSSGVMSKSTSSPGQDTSAVVTIEPSSSHSLPSLAKSLSNHDPGEWIQAMDSKFIKPLLTRPPPTSSTSSPAHPYLQQDVATTSIQSVPNYPPSQHPGESLPSDSYGRDT